MEELDQSSSITLDLLCIANTDGYFLRLNPSWEGILGLHPGRTHGAKRFLDFVHPDDLDKHPEGCFRSGIAARASDLTLKTATAAKTARTAGWNGLQPRPET